MDLAWELSDIFITAQYSTAMVEKWLQFTCKGPTHSLYKKIVVDEYHSGSFTDKNILEDSS